jgi:hypothetical protein
MGEHPRLIFIGGSRVCPQRISVGVLSVILFTFHSHLALLLVTSELLLGYSVVAGRGWE